MAQTLHYPGDVVDSLIAQTHPMGPDLYGAYYRVTAASYDSQLDRTTAQLQPIILRRLSQ